VWFFKKGWEVIFWPEIILIGVLVPAEIKPHAIDEESKIKPKKVFCR